MMVVLIIMIVLIFALFMKRRMSSSGAPTITFYTMPWCGACKKLQPQLDRLKVIGPPDLDVVQIDCSSDSCSQISKYPTIVSQGDEYKGDRTAEAMKAWALSRS